MSSQGATRSVFQPWVLAVLAVPGAVALVTWLVLAGPGSGRFRPLAAQPRNGEWAPGVSNARATVSVSTTTSDCSAVCGECKARLDQVAEELGALKETCGVSRTLGPASERDREGGGGFKQSREGGGIPRILHHIHIGQEGEGPSAHSRPWLEACKTIMVQEAGWQYKFWDAEAAEKFIKKVDPEFLQAFRSYSANVLRADALRYYLMKHIGGLYLDADVECWREGRDMLDGYDVVVQGDYPEHAATNSVMASKPGHALWDVAIELLKERKDRDHDNVGHVTGPQIIRDSLKRLFKVDTVGGLLPDEYNHTDGSRVRLHQLGSWYTPCGYSSNDCHLEIMLARATGRANMTRLVGFHRYTASWLGWREGIHPGTPAAASRAFCLHANKTGVVKLPPGLKLRRRRRRKTKK